MEKFGAPVYVRHEIVHNRTVVDSLAAQGAVFVEPVEGAPSCSRLTAYRAPSWPKRKTGG